MDLLTQETVLFRQRKAQDIAEAGRRVALRLCCGMDLPDTRTSSREDLLAALARVRRAIQRERMKAAVAHWSYDLNRHIALTQVSDDLQRTLGMPRNATREERQASKGNGARRRRRHVWHA